jgi:hypothetical protein
MKAKTLGPTKPTVFDSVMLAVSKIIITEVTKRKLVNTSSPFAT